VKQAQFILASASPPRSELLSRAGLTLEIVPSEVEENSEQGEVPEALASRLAFAKAKSVSERYPHSFVLGADTIVAVEHQGKMLVLGKPADAQDGRRMLSILQGRSHLVYTGFALLRALPHYEVCRTVATEVSFRALSELEIACYLKTPEPYDKAGAYAAQGQGATFVSSVRGSYTNVAGLPLCEVVEELARASIWNPEQLAVKPD
jgi:septum formation protein